MKRSKGTLSKSTRRMKVRKTHTATDILKSFTQGQIVIIEPVTKYSGYPHPRFRGRHGKVVCKRGKSYEIMIMDGNMEKILVVPSVHLKKA